MPQHEFTLREKMINLAEFYLDLANQYQVKDIEELRKLTYKLRETGTDIPYLMISTKTHDKREIVLTPQPITSQKTWKWLKDMDFTQDEEYYAIWVEKKPEMKANEFRIYIRQKLGKGKEAQRGEIYSQTYKFKKP